MGQPLFFATRLASDSEPDGTIRNFGSRSDTAGSYSLFPRGGGAGGLGLPPETDRITPPPPAPRGRGTTPPPPPPPPRGVSGCPVRPCWGGERGEGQGV